MQVKTIPRASEQHFLGHLLHHCTVLLLLFGLGQRLGVLLLQMEAVQLGGEAEVQCCDNCSLQLVVTLSPEFLQREEGKNCSPACRVACKLYTVSSVQFLLLFAEHCPNVAKWRCNHPAGLQAFSWLPALSLGKGRPF